MSGLGIIILESLSIVNESRKPHRTVLCFECAQCKCAFHLLPVSGGPSPLGVSFEGDSLASFSCVTVTVGLALALPQVTFAQYSGLTRGGEGARHPLEWRVLELFLRVRLVLLVTLPQRRLCVLLLYRCRLSFIGFAEELRSVLLVGVLGVVLSGVLMSAGRSVRVSLESPT